MFFSMMLFVRLGEGEMCLTSVLLCLSIHIKDDKIRSLEDQLREELTQISNTKEEFKVRYRTSVSVLVFK